MEEKTIFKLSLISSIIGIILIIGITNSLEPQTIKILDINRDLLDQQVKVSGKIDSIIKKDSLTILNVKDVKTIPIVLFENADFKKGSKVEVTGRVSEFQKELQITASYIKTV
ncbi:MAG: hypothetical protein Q8R00_03795 [Candidatus Nanoarchaeia archaeon]|nr:hypothetical protein [Candidatus Nanoarchaeia archaeon]